jgi:hypothetical protein
MAAHRTALPRRTGTRKAVLALAVVFIAAPANLARGDEPAELHHSAASDPVSADAESYAREFGVSTAEAGRRLPIQTELSNLAAEAQKAYPDRFAGAWLEHVPEFRLVVRFTGPDSTLDLTRVTYAAPAPVHVIANADYALHDLVAAIESLSTVVSRDFKEMGVEVDVKAGSLRIIGPSAIGDEALAELSAAAGGIPVKLQRTPREELLHTYGGRLLTLQANGQAECTTTFSIRNVVTSVTGVLTAGHCADSLKYWQDAQVGYNLTMFGQRWDGDQDWQWHTDSAGHPEIPQFYDGVAFRDVTATSPRSEMVGDFVCHWGIATGYSCGTVITIHYVSVDCNGVPCDPVWVRVEGSGLACYFGDSGGPFFRVTTAYGIMHSGSFSGPGVGQCAFATFNSIGSITGPNNNLEVLLAP